MRLILPIIAIIFLMGCSGPNDAVAQCLTDNGVTMYGAFWCPHCDDQKDMFGSSFKLINYVECSLPDKSGQTQFCKDAEIESYPTWEFSDGSRLRGLQRIDILAENAGC